jgi:hypothetical protein
MEPTRNWKKFWIIAGISLAGLLILSGLAFWIWYANWVNHVEKTELGFIFDKRTGQITKVEHAGWVIATPWWQDVHTIDLRPNQVCMNANQRVLNCKLVQFDPAGFNTFIDWHGRFAGPYVYEILRSYAFNVNEGRDCPFLTIKDDMRRKNSTSETK